MSKSFVIGMNADGKLRLASEAFNTHDKAVLRAESLRAMPYNRSQGLSFATYSNNWETRAQAEKYCALRNTGADVESAMKQSRR